MRRSDELSASEVVYEYSKYEALASIVGPFWAWLIMWFIRRGWALLFVAYMWHSWGARELRPAFVPTPAQRQSLEDQGRRFHPIPGVWYTTYQYDDNGNIEWVDDSEGVRHYGDPGRTTTPSSGVDGRRTQGVPPSAAWKAANFRSSH